MVTAATGCIMFLLLTAASAQRSGGGGGGGGGGGRYGVSTTPTYGGSSHGNSTCDRTCIIVVSSILGTIGGAIVIIALVETWPHVKKYYCSCFLESAQLTPVELERIRVEVQAKFAARDRKPDSGLLWTGTYTGWDALNRGQHQTQMELFFMKGIQSGSAPASASNSAVAVGCDSSDVYTAKGKGSDEAGAFTVEGVLNFDTCRLTLQKHYRNYVVSLTAMYTPKEVDQARMWSHLLKTDHGCLVPELLNIVAAFLGVASIKGSWHLSDEQFCDTGTFELDAVYPLQMWISPAHPASLLDCANLEPRQYLDPS